MRVAFWLLQDSIQQWSNWIAGLYYVQHCLEALTHLPCEDVPKVFVFLPESLCEKFVESEACQAASWLTIVPIDERWLQDSAGLKQLENLVASYDCDLFFPVMTPPIIPVAGKMIAWITDYQHKHYPDFFGADDLAYRDKLFSFLTCIADRVVCSSEAVQSDLERFYPLAKDRSFVLRFTVQPPAKALAGDIRSSLEKFAIRTPYAYLPYQFWSHKNHRVAFEAWRILKERGLNYTLICSGAKKDSRNLEHFRSLENYLRENQLEDSIRILGIVDRQDQWQLYRGAKLILQPSLFEGWSTSVEEARSLGKTIVLSDIPIHREQLSDGGNFFPPHDAENLAKIIEGLWTKLPEGHQPEFECQAVAAQRGRVQAFGMQLLKLFEDVLVEDREPIASQILPLFTFFQNEAKVRLAVIEALSVRLDSKKVSAKAKESPDSIESVPANASDLRRVLARARAWAARVFQL